MALSGNRSAFTRLEFMCNRSSSPNIRTIASGYLMLLLNSNPVPEVIPLDQEKSRSIAWEILPRFSTKIREDLSFHLCLRESRYAYKYGFLNHHEQFILGAICEYGICVPVDSVKASRLYSLSANQGNKNAQVQSKKIDITTLEPFRMDRLSANQFRILFILISVLGLLMATNWSCKE